MVGPIYITAENKAVLALEIAKTFPQATPERIAELERAVEIKKIEDHNAQYNRRRNLEDQAFVPAEAGFWVRKSEAASCFTQEDYDDLTRYEYIHGELVEAGSYDSMEEQIG